jgi:hypothetical protein
MNLTRDDPTSLGIVLARENDELFANICRILYTRAKLINKFLKIGAVPNIIVSNIRIICPPGSRSASLNCHQDTEAL